MISALLHDLARIISFPFHVHTSCFHDYDDNEWIAYLFKCSSSSSVSSEISAILRPRHSQSFFDSRFLILLLSLFQIRQLIFKLHSLLNFKVRHWKFYLLGCSKETGYLCYVPYLCHFPLYSHLLKNGRRTFLTHNNHVWSSRTSSSVWISESQSIYSFLFSREASGLCI